MSFTSRVPSVVPSLTQSSRPWSSSLAVKKTWLPDRTSSRGSEPTPRGSRSATRTGPYDPAAGIPAASAAVSRSVDRSAVGVARAIHWWHQGTREGTSPSGDHPIPSRAGPRDASGLRRQLIKRGDTVILVAQQPGVPTQSSGVLAVTEEARSTDTVPASLKIPPPASAAVFLLTDEPTRVSVPRVTDATTLGRRTIADDGRAPQGRLLLVVEPAPAVALVVRDGRAPDDQTALVVDPAAGPGRRAPPHGRVDEGQGPEVADATTRGPCSSCRGWSCPSGSRCPRCGARRRGSGISLSAMVVSRTTRRPSS